MRLVDADKLKVDYIVPSTTTNTACYPYVSYFQIKDAPTVDAVEVVRCKDCEHWFGGVCGLYMESIHMVCSGHTIENDFCSLGEREDDEI